MMKNTKEALLWIVDVLERNNIKYKITGGFAARIYGVKRDLADIDIEVLDRDIYKIVEDVKSYIIFGPGRYVDSDWNLDLLTLKYKEQEIDVAGLNSKIYNKQTLAWENLSSSLETVELREIFGKIMPIESLKSLIAYKLRLARDVDREDVKQLTSSVPLLSSISKHNRFVV